MFGELFATAVQGRKGAGVLLDAYSRDMKALKEMDFPLFYRGKNPKTSKGRCEINECQIPVTIDGVTICPGDYIFGDVDGVVSSVMNADEIIVLDAGHVVERGTHAQLMTQHGWYQKMFTRQQLETKVEGAVQ